MLQIIDGKLENPKSHSKRISFFFLSPKISKKSFLLLGFLFLRSFNERQQQGCLPCFLVSKTRKALLQDLDQGSVPCCFLFLKTDKDTREGFWGWYYWPGDFSSPN